MVPVHSGLQVLRVPEHPVVPAALKAYSLLAAWLSADPM